jgi:hypothetical protein
MMGEVADEICEKVDTSEARQYLNEKCGEVSQCVVMLDPSGGLVRS